MTTLYMSEAFALAKQLNLTAVLKRTPDAGAIVYFERDGATPSFFVGENGQPARFMSLDDAANMVADAGIKRCIVEM